MKIKIDFPKKFGIVLSDAKDAPLPLTVNNHSRIAMKMALNMEERVALVVATLGFMMELKVRQALGYDEVGYGEKRDLSPEALYHINSQFKRFGAEGQFGILKMTIADCKIGLEESITLAEEFIWIQDIEIILLNQVYYMPKFPGENFHLSPLPATVPQLQESN